jgi:hypothetical protein
MSQSEQIDALSKALAAAQGEMKNATLNRVNPHFKNRYADLAAIRDAVIPALSKRGIAMTQFTDFREGHSVLVTRLMHESGQWIEGAYPLAPAANPQAMGSQLTYARRYTLSAIAGISADEDDDAEIATANKNEPSGPITAEQLRSIRAAMNEVEADEHLFVKYLKVEKLEQLPASEYGRALAALNAKRGKAA